MKHEHHAWEIGKPLPKIRAHSLAKHRVLRGYLEKYVSVLTSDPRQDRFRLTLVDGFAGGGLYENERTGALEPGSPLIMLEAMAAAQIAAQSLRKKPFLLDVEYFFIEKNERALAHLRHVIQQSSFATQLQDRIYLTTGEFIGSASRIIDHIKKRGRAGRSIFFLDQFGYKDIPLSELRRILGDLNNAEVILTFATDFLIDYLTVDGATQERLERVGLTLPKATIETAKLRADWRRLIQFALYDQIPDRSGAKFFAPFFIRSTDSHRDFWLLHLSQHHRARDVMVTLHWQQNASFAHYGRSGLRMLGYDPELDGDWSEQRFLAGFFFDETALATTHEELCEQLPARIGNYKEGVQFTDLFSSISNETPATSYILKGVLSELAREGVIDVRSESGSKRRAGIVKPTDIVVPHQQKRIFFRP